MHSAFCSKLGYKLLVTACVDSHLAGMGGSSQVWVKMWWGRGHPVRTVQLSVRRVRLLDLVDDCDRTTVDAREVYHRSKQTQLWELLGFFYIYPQYGIPIGGDPPANGKRWAQCISNGLYYHADRIPNTEASGMHDYMKLQKAREEKKKKAYIEERERKEEAFVQRLLRENMEEDDPRDEDEEMDDPSLGPSCKRRRVQAGEFKFAASEAVSGTNWEDWEKRAAPYLEHLRIQRGGA